MRDNNAYLKEQNNQLDEAEKLYRQTIDIQPSFAPAQTGLGDVLSHAKGTLS